MIAQADALRIPLAPCSVHMAACSPPYWGLRAYQTGAQKARELGSEARHDCGAWTSGADPCGACFVCNMRSVAREVWRVLRDDGTWWLNLGDSYAANRGSGASASVGEKQSSNAGSLLGKLRVPDGLKAKDLAGIPWRVALALQADGWYLRSDIVWHKPSPMPESVTDRPTRAHEYVFLLTKSARYYYDAEAVKEAALHAGETVTHDAPKVIVDPGYDGHRTRTGMHGRDILIKPTRNRRTVWTVATQPYAGAHYAVWPSALVEPMILAGSRAGDIVLDPFCGSGTTGMVARQLGRRFVGLDLSMVYLREQALPRAERKSTTESIETLPLFGMSP